MKNRILKEKLFIYKSGNLKIQSKIELTQEEVEQIFKIIRRYTSFPFFGMYARIIREIVRQVDSVKLVELFVYRTKLLFKIG